MPNACEFSTGQEKDSPFFFGGNAADGATIRAPLEEDKVRLNVSATFLAPPALEIDGRIDLGSITGGESVVLKGLHLAEVSASVLAASRRRASPSIPSSRSPPSLRPARR